MPVFTKYPVGCPCWIDLMSPDVEASSSFYSAVFGWEARPEHDDKGNRIYTTFLQGDQAVAGMGGQPPGMEGMPALWNSYVNVEDAAASAAAAEAAGGSVMMPAMQVMDAGHMAIIADPTGAAISVWQPGNHFGATIANEPDTWSWNELASRDVETAKAFYAEVFGWNYDAMDMGGDTGVYHVIKGAKDGWGGLMTMPPTVPDEVPSHWVVYFLVSDADATAEAVTAAGGQTVQAPFEIPGVGRMAVFADPQGGTFSVMQSE